MERHLLLCTLQEWNNYPCEVQIKEVLKGTFETDLPLFEVTFSLKVLCQTCFAIDVL